MDKKLKIKRFTKEELKTAKKIGDSQIVSELVGRIHRNEKMSVAETEFVCSILRASKLEGDISFVNLAAIPACQDYIFRTLYISYFQDLDGKYGIDKFTGLVSIDEKREDTIRLNEYYKSWGVVISTNRHEDNLLNFVINEINKDLKHTKKLFENRNITQEEYLYKVKSITLHSKYIYQTARAFFDEYQSDSVVCMFHGKEIEITEHSFVHILNRHMAGAAKQFDTGKSFHMDRRIKWFEMPSELKNILEKIGGNEATKNAIVKYIPFKYNGQIYGIWTEQQIKHEKGKAIKYIRLETFYPIEKENDLLEIQNTYREVNIDSDLNAFVKK